VSGAPDRPLKGLFALLDRLRRKQGRKIADTLVMSAVAGAAALLALGLSATTPFRFLEDFTADMRIALAAPPPVRNMVVIKIDDASINQMREQSACHCFSPIDKVWLGDLIKTLDDKGVKAIGVDYLLDTYASRQEFEEFQKRVEHLRAPLIVAVDPNYKAGVDFPVARGVRYSDARALAHKNYDNVISLYDPRPSQYWALASEVGRAIGLNPPTKQFAIRYRRPDASAGSAENAGAPAPSYSAAFIPFTPEAFLKGKIAFIGSVTRSAGADANTLKEDMHTTPLRFLRGHDAGTPGVEVHVHALDQMLRGDRIREPGQVWAAIIVLFAALGGAALGRSTQKWWASLLIVVGGLVVAGVGSFLLYRYSAILFPLTAPSFSFAFAFFMQSRLAAAELQSQRAFYSSTLERYLAPQVIDRMVEGQEAVRIGAEERDISVMISDLENFSNLVASLDLETFTGVINEYLGGMLDLLWKHEAMIDKMTGDGVIAIFGAPVETPGHADRAIACAREIDVYAEQIRERMLARGIAFGHTRMGISSGVAMVGNFGGERRFNYTAYGETVVIAARLEAANKTFNTRILFSAETLRRAQNRDIPISPVGEIDLKGVPQPIPAFTIAT
jgi:class 3 adenylate cyclase